MTDTNSTDFNNSKYSSFRIPIVLRFIAVILLLIISIFFFYQSANSLREIETKIESISLNDSRVDAAISEYKLNAALSDNVYQQQVVALWGVKDLTEVSARRLGSIEESIEITNLFLVSYVKYINTLLFLLVAMIGVMSLVVTDTIRKIQKT